MLHISDRRLKKSINPLVTILGSHMLPALARIERATFTQAMGLDEKASAAGKKGRICSRSLCGAAPGEVPALVTVRELWASQIQSSRVPQSAPAPG